MLIRSNQLTLNEASAILDNGVYLTEAEAALNPVAVPVLENNRLGICTVSYNDIQRVSEDYGCYNYDALHSIAEASNISVDDIAVAIDESDIILDPSIVSEFPKYVVKPLSENSVEFLFTESCLELFLESGNYDYMELLTEGKKVKKGKIPVVVAQNAEERTASKLANVKAPSAGYNYASGTYETPQNKHTSSVQNRDAAIMSAIGRSSTGLENIKMDNVENGDWKTGLVAQEKIDRMATKKEMQNKAFGNATRNLPDKNVEEAKKLMDGKNEDNPGFISRKVAALRKFYRNFLNQANKEKEEGKIKWYKNIARVILKYIDKLLAKLDKTKYEDNQE